MFVFCDMCHMQVCISLIHDDKVGGSTPPVNGLIVSSSAQYIFLFFDTHIEEGVCITLTHDDTVAGSTFPLKGLIVNNPAQPMLFAL